MTGLAHLLEGSQGAGDRGQRQEEPLAAGERPDRLAPLGPELLGVLPVSIEDPPVVELDEQSAGILSAERVEEPSLEIGHDSVLIDERQAQRPPLPSHCARLFTTRTAQLRGPFPRKRRPTRWASASTHGESRTRPGQECTARRR